MNASALAALSVTILSALLCACQPDAEAGADDGSGPMTFPTRPVRDVLGAKLTELGVEARVGVLSAPELRNNVGLMPGETAAAGAPDGDVPGGSDPDSRDPDSSDPDGIDPVIRDGAAAAKTEPSPEESAGSDSGLDPELVEMREGLIAMAGSSERNLNTAKKDIAHLKDEIAPVMAAGFAVEGRSPEASRILIDLALMSPSLGVAEGIAGLAFASEEAWLRRYAAWALASLADIEGTDQLIPRLIRRLKYERDPEALVWVASTLTAFDNYAGVGSMYDSTARPAGDPAGDAARIQLGAALQRATEALGKEETLDTAAVRLAWAGGRLGRPRDGISSALLAEVWLLVADMSGEHFQLRGVDDARQTLSLLGPWAAVELALALEDDDEYVRLHTAQVLERMKARGGAAYDSLQAALLDPHDAVAGAAAEAIVAVTRGTDRAPSAKETLLVRLRSVCPYEVKVACVRALGQMDPKMIPADDLAEIFDGTKLSDMRLAAAPGLLNARNDGATLAWLADELANPQGDPSGAEDVLGDWLTLRAVADGSSPDIEAAKAAWEAEAPPMSVVHTAEQAGARRVARGEAIRATLGNRMTQSETPEPSSAGAPNGNPEGTPEADSETESESRSQ